MWRRPHGELGRGTAARYAARCRLSTRARNIPTGAFAPKHDCRLIFVLYRSRWRAPRVRTNRRYARRRRCFITSPKKGKSACVANREETVSSTRDLSRIVFRPPGRTCQASARSNELSRLSISWTRRTKNRVFAHPKLLRMPLRSIGRIICWASNCYCCS